MLDLLAKVEALKAGLAAREREVAAAREGRAAAEAAAEAAAAQLEEAQLQVRGRGRSGGKLFLLQLKTPLDRNLYMFFNERSRGGAGGMGACCTARGAQGRPFWAACAAACCAAPPAASQRPARGL